MSDDWRSASLYGPYSGMDWPGGEMQALFGIRRYNVDVVRSGADHQRQKIIGVHHDMAVVGTGWRNVSPWGREQLGHRRDLCERYRHGRRHQACKMRQAASSINNAFRITVMQNRGMSSTLRAKVRYMDLLSASVDKEIHARRSVHLYATKMKRADGEPEEN